MSASETACGYAKQGVGLFFEYDTAKIVHIRSKSIGIVNRLVQLGIIGYIIIYVFIYKQEYQLEDIGVSGTTTKVKGVTYTDVKDPRVGSRVWDTTDIVVPAEENNAFFVTTNVIVTDFQTPGECPESNDVDGANCTIDADCPVNKAYLLGHGVNTGTCNTITGTCMIKAWCPLENDTLPTDYAVLNGTEEFTVLIKNYVFFPYYNKRRSNILESTNATYLQKCTYDSNTDPFCPVFKLQYIVDKAHAKLPKTEDLTYEDIAKLGGVMSIKISWDCNFNYDPKKCKPVYDFDRLDKGEDSLIAKGYNYRYSHNYFQNTTEYRQQIKAYGILFIITVDAKAAAFNIVPTLTNLGSGLALLSIATVVCDIFVLYLHKYKKLYRSHKYQEVDTSSDYGELE